MKWAAIARAVIFVLSFIFGIFMAREFLSFSIFKVPYATEIAIGLLLALLSVYLVPLLGPFIAKWFSKLTIGFARRVASEVISQLRLPQVLDRLEMPSLPGRGDREPKYLNPMILDTSAIIDGRVSSIADSGFLYGTLVVPRFVLSELQHIADSEETIRRNRGRRGFEVLEALKKNKLVKFEVVNDKKVEGKNVDDKIIALAHKIKAKIITTDFNLNKVASSMDVKTLNVNELVNVIKSPMLPGEPIEVKVIQEGKEKDQGVGYLPDGTMIVVESGAQFVGKKIEAVVSRVLQTVAGRMIFVKVESEKRPPISPS